MKQIIFVSIFSMNIFILISAFFLQNLKLDITFLYYPFCILIALLSYGVILLKMIKSKRIKISFFYLFLFIALLIISFLSSEFKNDDIVKVNFYLFFIWSAPAALAGIYFSDIDKNDFEKLTRKLYYFNSFFIIFTILIPFIRSNLEKPISLGLMNYQNITYITAFTIGLGLYFINSESEKSLKFIILNIILLPVIFIGAGRGGTLVLIVYVLITLINILRNKKIKMHYKFFISLFSIIGCFIFYQLSMIFDKDNRIFAYITADGINLDEGASGRNIVYEMDIDAIAKSPIFGYGFFNYYQLTYSVPHNLFLEILLIGGILLGVVFIFFLLFLIIKIIRNYSDISSDKLILYIAVYPIMLLMFSTNFLVVSEFWFFIFYFISKSNFKVGKKYNI